MMRVNARLVEQDLFEENVRMYLNLGHTFAHAIEHVSDLQIPHGEAVAMGLAWEAVFARRQGLAGPEVEDAVVGALSAMGFALDDPDLPLSLIAAAIGMDKKRVASDIDMLVVSSPGRCALRRVAISLVRKELPAIRAELRERLRPRDRMPDAASEARGGIRVLASPMDASMNRSP